MSRFCSVLGCSVVVLGLVFGCSKQQEQPAPAAPVVEQQQPQAEISAQKPAPVEKKVEPAPAPRPPEPTAKEKLEVLKKELAGLQAAGLYDLAGRFEALAAVPDDKEAAAAAALTAVELYFTALVSEQVGQAADPKAEKKPVELLSKALATLPVADEDKTVALKLLALFGPPPAEAADSVAEGKAALLRGLIQRNDFWGVLARHLLATGAAGRIAALPQPPEQGLAYRDYLDLLSGAVLAGFCPQCLKTGENAPGLYPLLAQKDLFISCSEAPADTRAALDAILAGCPENLCVSKEDAALITPDSAKLLGSLALLRIVLREDTVTLPLLDAQRAATLELLKKAVPGGLFLFRAWNPDFASAPKEIQDLFAGLTLAQTGELYDYLPSTFLRVSGKDVSLGSSGATRFDGQALESLDRSSGLMLPGKPVIPVTDLKAMIEARKDKDGKLPKIPLQAAEHTFEVEDIHAQAVQDEVRTVAATLAEAEARTWPGVTGKGVVNGERQTTEAGKRLGETFQLFLEPDTDTLTARAALLSLALGGFRDLRIAKPTAPRLVLPAIYFSELYLDPEVLDTTYKRPIIAYINDKGRVAFYPPADSYDRSFMQPKRKPVKKAERWPGKYRSIVDDRIQDPAWNLFLSYTETSRPGWLDEAAGIAREMQAKWDAGNLFYVVADDTVPAILATALADRLAHLQTAGMKNIARAFPGMLCAADQTGCPSEIVVLYPDVDIPRLPGKVKLKEAEQQVYCDKGDIQAKINAKRGALKFCYDPELQKNPALKGRVTYQFTIDAEGAVKEISAVADELGNQKVVDCAKNTIQRIRFRKPVGGECTIRYPYLFTP